MKLVDSENKEGFYESFSDIIFATLAIFVLLMILFMALAQVSSPIVKAYKELELKKTYLESVKSQQSEVNESIALKKVSLEKLRNQRVEIVIAVDKSGSMTRELSNLSNAINQLTEILPNLIDDFNISVIAYLSDDNNKSRDITQEFPLSKIEPEKLDKGASQKRVEDFLSRQFATGGSVPVLPAVKRAINQFSKSAGIKDHQVLMILGDVGPFERDVPINAHYITKTGEQRGRELVNTVNDWVKGKPNRNLIVLFSGRDEMSRWNAGADWREKHRRSMLLFKEIAKASGQPEAYTENPSSMLVDFLVAALKRK